MASSSLSLSTSPPVSDERECMYCKKKVSSLAGLHRHQLTNKSCIIIQLMKGDLTDEERLRLENKVLKYQLNQKDTKIFELTELVEELELSLEEHATRESSDKDEAKLREDIPEYREDAEKGDSIVDLAIESAELYYALTEIQQKMKDLCPDKGCEMFKTLEAVNTELKQIEDGNLLYPYIQQYFSAQQDLHRLSHTNK